MYFNWHLLMLRVKEKLRGSKSLTRCVVLQSNSQHSCVVQSPPAECLASNGSPAFISVQVLRLAEVRLEEAYLASALLRLRPRPSVAHD